MIKRIKSGGVFEDKIGYCRAVVAGGFVHVAGTVAPGPDLSPDVTDQCKAALDVIRAALEKAGSGMDKVVRVNYYLPDAAEFEPCWPILSEAFGDHPPAATMIVADLIAPQYRIEIEVTALAA